jgi:NAD(P)-dependent dehydrogenase (short-subunit alcohol dehydrogenase family)
MPGKLEGRTALVTGGGRGIGEAICRRFAGEGARVAVADIDADTAEATSADLPIPGLPIRMDVSSTREVREGVDRVAAEFGHLDILVNNAGYLVHTKVHDCSEEEWDKQIDINLKGMFFCSQAALNLMMPRRRGVILSMSSLAAKNGGLAASAPYAAAKGAIFTLTITLARYAAPHGIRVNALAPGVIDTPMTRGLSPDHADLASTIPLGEKGQPEDVAACALFLASDDARHITGETVDVNGGLFMD